MIIVVTGGRDYSDSALVDMALSNVRPRPNMVIHGGASGADRLAKNWAASSNIHHAEVPALWGSRYGRAAGPRRNAAMLTLGPSLCVAFPGGRGTASMIRECEKAGIPVVHAKDLAAK